MRYPELRVLKNRLFFTPEDLGRLLNINTNSAKVFCTRYINKGLFVRLKRNLYVLSERWDGFSRDDLLRISNLLQVPSYVSFTTALSFYEVTTQVQRDFFECASLRRTIRYNIKGTTFNYYKIQKKCYFDFIKRGDIFIATQEKAFIDSVYLYSFGRYKLDFGAIEFERLNKERIKELSILYPERTRKLIKRLCRI
jgi:predicted transcriptional regulator of viral defense system